LAEEIVPSSSDCSEYADYEDIGDEAVPEFQPVTIRILPWTLEFNEPMMEAAYQVRFVPGRRDGTAGGFDLSLRPCLLSDAQHRSSVLMKHVIVERH